MTTLARAATIKQGSDRYEAEPTRYQNGAKDDHKRNDACDAPFPLATPVSYFAVAQDIDNPVLAILFPEIESTVMIDPFEILVDECFPRSREHISRRARTIRDPAGRLTCRSASQCGAQPACADQGVTCGPSSSSTSSAIASVRICVAGTWLAAIVPCVFV